MKTLTAFIVALALAAIACGSATPTERATEPVEITVSPEVTLPFPIDQNESGPDLPSIPAGGEQATVTHVIDGDTIDMRIQGQTYRVRYIGMDTPEQGDPFFNEATEANADLVDGREVVLVKDVSETDRYGRLLRYVYLLDGTFVNAELVRSGYAQVATFPPDMAHQELFLQLQR